jgi:hypothetical protein
MEQLIEEHFIKIRECEKRIRDLKNELQFWNACSVQVILLRSLLDDEYDRMSMYLSTDRRREYSSGLYINTQTNEKKVYSLRDCERRCSL